MLGLAALALAAASANASPPLTSAMPWWEKFTFTMAGDGSQESCKYESSVPSAIPESCGDESDAATAQAAQRSSAAYTKITVERRFTPTEPEAVALEAGDKLLGGQVMSLVIDAKGTVRSCAVVDTSGVMRPPYGCTDARAERFEASSGRSARSLRQGYMTVLVYGHEEYPV